MTETSRLEELKGLINQRNYRLTPQRQQVLEIFLKNPDRHLSADEIYALAHRENPEIGMATVYRTLELLSDLKIIQPLNFGDGRSRYELTREDKHTHHHLICLSCGKVGEVDEDLLEKLEEAIEREYGFRIVDHKVQFSGYCAACRRKMRD